MTFIKVLEVAPSRAQPLFERSAAHVDFRDGFWDEEADETHRYRWMNLRGIPRFAPDPGPRYLELWVLSEFHDLSQVVTVSSGDHHESFRLVHGWSPLSVFVPPGADAVELSANKPFPAQYYPNDGRVLSIRVREPRLHGDEERHTAIRKQQLNLVANVEELLAGRIALGSTPPTLGIDMYGVCNVKPPCVYCEWDFNKDLEGENADAPFTRDTLQEWGPFFENSVNLVNCSIGEPFMMKNFDELLDIFGAAGKVLELTTNGQILTERNVQKLVGRPIELYISLDAATPLTYSRLRNDAFEKILKNLRHLIAAKGGRGAWPLVYLVFMPMRCNLHELDAFVQLCAELGVDRLVLRPLNFSEAITLEFERAGYHWVYERELLPFEELVRASGRAARLCHDLHVDLSDQMDFGGAMRPLFEEEYTRGEQSADETPTVDSGVSVPEPAAIAVESPDGEPAEAVVPPRSPESAEPPLPSLGSERQPACLEPWKSLYILRRGVFPCCYGVEPVAPMHQYGEAWNSPLTQSIRRDLLQGRFHDYCLRSVACPIVRKSEQAGMLPVWPRVRLKLRAAWWRFNRAGHGVPDRVWTSIKWLSLRVGRALTSPSYVAHHVKRLAGFPRAR